MLTARSQARIPCGTLAIPQQGRDNATRTAMNATTVIASGPAGLLRVLVRGESMTFMTIAAGPLAITVVAAHRGARGLVAALPGYRKRAGGVCEPDSWRSA
jgi:hypothetical protein